MSKHTPGPWVAERFGDKWGIYRADEHGGFAVAEVEVSRPGFTHPRDRADALLIAASPAMYEALKRLVDQSDAMAREWSQGDWRAVLSMVRGLTEEARAALRAAEGKEPTP